MKCELVMLCMLHELLQNIIATRKTVKVALREDVHVTNNICLQQLPTSAQVW